MLTGPPKEMCAWLYLRVGTGRFADACVKGAAENAGLRLLRQTAIDAKKLASAGCEDKRLSNEQRAANAEAVEWITLWLQSPELFETWVKMRVSTKEFKSRFGVLK